MAETYYTGPIALKVATPYGGDLGKSNYFPSREVILTELCRF
jgi:hypothetical protein